MSSSVRAWREILRRYSIMLGQVRPRPRPSEYLIDVRLSQPYRLKSSRYLPGSNNGCQERSTCMTWNVWRRSTCDSLPPAPPAWQPACFVSGQRFFRVRGHGSGRMVTPSVIMAASLLIAGKFPRAPLWQQSRIIILSRARELFARVRTSIILRPSS